MCEDLCSTTENKSVRGKLLFETLTGNLRSLSFLGKMIFEPEQKGIWTVLQNKQ